MTTIIFPENAELILSQRDRICSPVYFGMPNSAYFFFTKTEFNSFFTSCCILF